MAPIAYYDTCPLSLQETLLVFENPEEDSWYHPFSVQEISFSHDIFSGTGRILAASHAVSIHTDSVSLAQLVTCVPIPGLCGVPLLSRNLVEQSEEECGIWKNLRWNSFYIRRPIEGAALSLDSFPWSCTQIFPGDGDPRTQLGIEAHPDMLRVHSLHTYPNQKCAVQTLLEVRIVI